MWLPALCLVAADTVRICLFQIRYILRRLQIFGHHCVAGVGVLLCAMCPSVLLLCLRTLFLQVSFQNYTLWSNTFVPDDHITRWCETNWFACVSDTGQFVRSLVCMLAVWCWHSSSWALECSAHLLVGYILTLGWSTLTSLVIPNQTC